MRLGSGKRLGTTGGGRVMSHDRMIPSEVPHSILGEHRRPKL